MALTAGLSVALEVSFVLCSWREREFTEADRFDTLPVTVVERSTRA
jgi:hypothetical protein